MGASPDQIWTDDDVNALGRLWQEGHSATVIARHLGRTRNAVLGKVHRMSLSARRVHRSPEQRQAARKAAYRKHYVTKQQPKRQAAKLVVPEPPATLLPPLMLSVMEIGPRQCRYGIGDPRQVGFGFCGHETKPGSSFCVGHHAACWVPAPVRKRAQ